MYVCVCECVSECVCDCVCLCVGDTFVCVTVYKEVRGDIGTK